MILQLLVPCKWQKRSVRNYNVGAGLEPARTDLGKPLGVNPSGFFK
jgi:hypothetical protein